jgi:hypothetical protein
MRRNTRQDSRQAPPWTPPVLPAARSAAANRRASRRVCAMRGLRCSNHRTSDRDPCLAFEKEGKEDRDCPSRHLSRYLVQGGRKRLKARCPRRGAGRRDDGNRRSHLQRCALGRGWPREPLDDDDLRAAHDVKAPAGSRAAPRGVGGEGMKIAAMLVALVLVLAPTSASAECAWVLWVEAPVGSDQWSVASVPQARFTASKDLSAIRR